MASNYATPAEGVNVRRPPDRAAQPPGLEGRTFMPEGVGASIRP